MSANAIVGEVVRRQHTVIGFAGAVTGLTISDFTVSLFLDGDPASETVVLSELGSGNYEFLFTPLSAGVYTFFGTEDAFPNSQQLSFNDAWITVLTDAVFTPAPANAFCSMTDVEAYVGREFDSLSRPTEASILGFMENCARQLTSICEIAGKRVTPSGGDTPLGFTGRDPELAAMLRCANVYGAAIAIENGGYLGVPPAESERANYFYLQFLQMAGGLIPGTGQTLEGAIPAYIKGAYIPGAYASTHISSGQVERYTAPSGLKAQLFVDERTEF